MKSRLRPLTLITLLLSLLFLMTGCPDQEEYLDPPPYYHSLEPNVWHTLGLEDKEISGLYVSETLMLASTRYDQDHPGNGSLLRSTNLGFNWYDVMTQYDIVSLDVNVADSNYIYIAGTNYANGIPEPKMMISRDRGDTWTLVSHPTDNLDEFPLFLKCHPQDYRLCYMGMSYNDGSRLYRSSDAGNNWIRIDENGVEGTIVDVAMFSYRSDFILVGTLEAPYVYRSYDNGDSWEDLFVTSGGELQYLETMEDEIFAGFSSSGIYESNDMGNIWQYMGPDEAGLSGITSVKGNIYYSITDPFNGVYGQYFSGSFSNWYRIGGISTIQSKPVIAGFDRVIVLGDMGFHVYLIEE